MRFSSRLKESRTRFWRAFGGHVPMQIVEKLVSLLAPKFLEEGRSENWLVKVNFLLDITADYFLLLLRPTSRSST